MTYYKDPSLTPVEAMTVPDFQLERYLGRWYEMSRDKDTKFQKGDYTTADYAWNEAKTGISVTNNEYIDGKMTKEPVVGRGECNHADRGICRVAFSRFQPWGNYWILDTDYDNYAVVYSKVTGFWSNFLDFEFLWVLTRKPLEKRTKEWNRIKAKAGSVIRKKLPDYDLE